MVESKLLKYKYWGAIPAIDQLFDKYSEQTVKLTNGVWENKNLTISPPDYDSLLAYEFIEHIREGGSDAQTWLKLKGKKGIIVPKITGISTKLLFSYNSGLYINYTISEVHYFPGHYLLLFTNQNQTSVGGDTMQGFFIFKITNET